jgi:hypothetical protein
MYYVPNNEERCPPAKQLISKNDYHSRSTWYVDEEEEVASLAVNAGPSLMIAGRNRTRKKEGTYRAI